MATKVLLKKRIYHLGRPGDIVLVKPGYARNYLYPQGIAAPVTKATLAQQKRLQEEAARQAAEDKAASEELAKKIGPKTRTIEVKVDPEGRMYGSVAAVDIVKLLSEEGIEVDRRNVQLPQPIKKVGEHEVEFVLLENVPASFTLKVVGEGHVEDASAVVAEVPAEGEAQEAAPQE